MDEKPFIPPRFDLLADLRPAHRGGDGVLTYFGIEYAKIDRFRPLELDLMIPTSGQRALVVYIHGGAWRNGSRHENWVSGPIWRDLLNAGLAVASIDYRLSGEAPFPACVNDAKAAVRWLRRFGSELGVSTDAIGVLGESAGGHIAAFLGLNTTVTELEGGDGVLGESTEVQAAVVWYAPTDLSRMDEQAKLNGGIPHNSADSPESLLVGGALQQKPDRTAWAGPTNHVSGAAAPFMLIHGRDDRVVPYQQSTEFAEALRGAGVSADLQIIEGADHVFKGVDREPIIERSARFLASQLSDAVPSWARPTVS
ncbi:MULTISPECIES: alpha/beta hydrolase [unclassified Arthrobacter]|uniref:alpha/beta hydrolase n=1 Tax=unclassified Arthrobacter TaxID=235627 RepID=UPI001C855DC6|nr:alpha/beta hydrolase [Arthrobacter sp. MAHUQ-56]MBX7445921.1 alpha/beta hydrolase [Arthrobacter sp. MAHUQ-56]